MDIQASQDKVMSTALGAVALLDAKMRVVCIDPARGKPVPMPHTIQKQLSALQESSQ